MGRWFRVRFEVYAELKDSAGLSDDAALAVARDRAKEDARCIDEHMGSLSSGDPYFYQTHVALVEPLVGPPLCTTCAADLAAPDKYARVRGLCDECGERASRVVESDGSSTRIHIDGRTGIAVSSSNKSLEEVRAEARAYLEGLRKNVR